MAARNKNQTVEYVEYTPGEYSKDSTLQELENKYGKISRYTNIYLKRKQKDGRFANLEKPSEPPDEEYIIETYGGGEFQIDIQFIPENPEPDRKDPRSHVVYTLIVEGPPKHPANTAAAPAPVLNGSTPDIAAIVKELTSRPNNDNAMLSVILPLMMKMNDNTTNMIVAMIQGMNKGSNGTDPIMLEILKPIINKNSEGEIERYMKFDKLRGTGEKESGDLTMKDVLVPLMTVLTKGGGPGPGIPGANGVPQLGAGAQGSGTQRIEAMLQDFAGKMDQNLSIISNQISGISKHLNYVEEYLQDDDEYTAYSDSNVPESLSKESGTIQPPNTVNTSQNNGDMNKLYAAYGAQLRNMTLADKITELKKFIAQGSTLEDIYKFCLTYGAVSTICEFNDIVKAAGMVELQGCEGESPAK